MAKKKGGNSSGRPMSKSQVFGELAEGAELTRKQVGGLFENLSDLIKRELKKGPGVFTVPGLMKIKVIRKKATKERVGVNPFTGQEQVFKAKPARNVVKVLALKNLKQMV